MTYELPKVLHVDKQFFKLTNHNASPNCLQQSKIGSRFSKIHWSKNIVMTSKMNAN